MLSRSCGSRRCVCARAGVQACVQASRVPGVVNVVRLRYASAACVLTQMLARTQEEHTQCVDKLDQVERDHEREKEQAEKERKALNDRISALGQGESNAIQVFCCVVCCCVQLCAVSAYVCMCVCTSCVRVVFPCVCVHVLTRCLQTTRIGVQSCLCARACVHLTFRLSL